MLHSARGILSIQLGNSPTVARNYARVTLTPRKRLAVRMKKLSVYLRNIHSISSGEIAASYSCVIRRAAAAEVEVKKLPLDEYYTGGVSRSLQRIAVRVET